MLARIRILYIEPKWVYRILGLSFLIQITVQAWLLTNGERMLASISALGHTPQVFFFKPCCAGISLMISSQVLRMSFSDAATDCYTGVGDNDPPLHDLSTTHN